MIPFFILISFVLSNHGSIAFSWRQSWAPIVASDQALDPLMEDELGALLVNKASLEHQSGKPDCFRRAAGLVRSRCSELDMNEKERIQAAISLTLCELATARYHSLPMECAPFAPDAATDHPNGQSEGDCVQALSRSTQSWSSYSGYLREVPQLCYAFRRWNDIDVARDIYKNITSEKAELIRFILAHEKSVQQSSEMWQYIVQDMKDLVAQSSSSLEASSQGLLLSLESKSDKMIAAVVDAVEDLYRRLILRHSQALNEMGSTFEDSVHEHRNYLESLVPVMQESLSAHLRPVVAVLQTQSQRSFDLAEQTYRQWIDLDKEIAVMQKSIAHMTGHAFRAADALDSTVHQSQLWQQTQREATTEAATLVSTITQLTDTARSELETMNGTALLLRQQLNPGSQWGDWWTTGAMRAVELVWRVNPVHFDYLRHIPLIRATWTVLQLSSYLLRAVCSSSMSVFIVLLSFKKFVSRRFPVADVSSSLTSRSPLPPLPASPLNQDHWPSERRLRVSTRLHASPRLRISRIPDRLCMPTAPS